MIFLMQNIKTKWNVLNVFQVFFLLSPNFTEKSADLWTQAIKGSPAICG